MWMSGVRFERDRVFPIKKGFAFVFILVGRAKNAVTVPAVRSWQLQQHRAADAVRQMLAQLDVLSL